MAAGSGRELELLGWLEVAGHSSFGLHVLATWQSGRHRGGHGGRSCLRRDEAQLRRSRTVRSVDRSARHSSWAATACSQRQRRQPPRWWRWRPGACGDKCFCRRAGAHVHRGQRDGAVRQAQTGLGAAQQVRQAVAVVAAVRFSARWMRGRCGARFKRMATDRMQCGVYNPTSPQVRVASKHTKL